MIRFPALRRKQGPEPIETARLQLRAITPTLVAQEEAGPAALSEALRAEVTTDWPPEHWGPHVRTHMLAQFQAHPETIGWHRFMLLARKPRVLIGCLGAFPCAVGDVEIGYSVISPYQRQGYGSEAALAFVEWLLKQSSVHSVSAQTYETLPASVKVMKHCGMRFIGPGDEAGTVRYRRWR